MSLAPANLPPGTSEQFGKTARWIKDRYAYVTEACWTYDEIEAAAHRNPVRRFPDKPHIYAMVRAWEKKRRLALVKSRRMMATWTMLALDLHLAMTAQYAKIFVISDDQMKSDQLLARMKFIYDHLPREFLKPGIKTHSGQHGDPTRLDFTETGSVVLALPEDPDKIRQEGASLLHVEEFQVWQWPETSYRAMLPTIQGGGKIVIVGTAQANSLYQKIVFDDMGTMANTGALNAA